MSSPVDRMRSARVLMKMFMLLQISGSSSFRIAVQLYSKPEN